MKRPQWLVAMDLAVCWLGFVATVVASDLGSGNATDRELGWQPNWTQAIDRPFTLRLAEPLALEREVARQMQSGKPLSFIYPRACFSEIDSSRVCGEPPGFSWRDDRAKRALGISPVLGYEYRYLHENVSAFEAGLFTAGGSGPVSFDLDARMFTEMHEKVNAPSYDREFIEKQDEETSGSVAYTSFSRYRAHLSLDLAWGRLMAGRDAVHWGPGLYENLVFNKDAVPFNQVTFTTHLGPLTVQSLYGQLQVEDEKVFGMTAKSRSVYGHRYELRLGPDWLLGVSEQMVLYSYEEPFAVLPVVPLFIFKGGAYERLNNGNLAFDVNWRFKNWGRVYGEFLIDDMQSPTALFNDQWGNKWAVMGGLQVTGELRGWEMGGVVEAARIEPWVYTHYTPATAQAANLGYPLGNQRGPNGQSVLVAIRAGQHGLMVSLVGRLDWKGTDLGSWIGDSHGQGEEKVFLKGVTDPKAGLGANVAKRWARSEVSVGLEVVGMEVRCQGRVMGWY